MRKKIYIFLLSFFLLVLAGYFLFQEFKKPPIDPVIIIGLDGADWNIINPLLERDKLPNLARLIREGCSGVLKTIRPTKSPVIWTSIATGKTMIKHGILDWRFVTKNNIEVPYSAGERRVKTFWNILSEKGFTVGVINWFCTFPVEEVNGYLISDRLRIGIYKYLTEDEVTFPAELKDKIFPKIVKFRDKKFKKIIREEGMWDYWTKSIELNIDVPENRDKHIKRFQTYTLQDKSIENISLFLLENISVDLFATYLRLIDTTSHFTSIFVKDELREIWIEENEKYGGPTPEAEKILYQNMTTIIEPVYSYLDNVVGRIMSRARENTTFILVSDHGFNFSPQGYGHYERPVIPHGIIIIKGPGIKQGYHLENAHIFDVTPTILYLFALPVSKDMDGQVLLEAFQNDFKKRRNVRYIPTYESISAPSKEKKPKALDKEVLEELKSLGYIH